MRCDSNIIEMADEARARVIARATNATVIRRRKTGQIVAIDLADQGWSKDPSNLGNPRSYSHNHETNTNPPRVWTLKRIPKRTGDIFGAVVNGCAA